MFKKSLAAVAVLGAFAGSAFAAEVTMYGVIDTGLMYTYEDVADGDATTDLEQHTLGLEGGINSSNRFGVKGTEELGNGMKVGFKLENGFKSDTGALKTKDTLFDREASVSLYGDFGTLSMGLWVAWLPPPVRTISSIPWLMPSTVVTTIFLVLPSPVVPTT